MAYLSKSNIQTLLISVSNIGTSNIGSLFIAKVPMFQQFKHRQQMFVAEGRRGKSFSGGQGANEYGRLYAPLIFNHMKTFWGIVSKMKLANLKKIRMQHV